MTFAATTEDQVRETYRAFLVTCPDAEVLASRFSGLAVEKYDPFLSDALQAQVFASHRLDLGGAIELIKNLHTRELSGPGQ